MVQDKTPYYYIYVIAENQAVYIVYSSKKTTYNLWLEIRINQVSQFAKYILKRIGCAIQMWK